MTKRAGLYVRISEDRSGAGLGVERQEADCRALCAQRGWSVADTYVDNDVSAYSGKPRPAWRRLLADVEAGAVHAIVCWHVDRLTRTPRELEDVISYAESRGLYLATVTGEVDLATPTGRMVARILGAAARGESEHKAERQARERRQSAESGKVAGGGTRPYGYDDDRVTVLSHEAQVICEMAARVLADESLSSVCRDLQARGVTTPTGGHWQPRTLRRLLASARISGRREHTPRASYQGTRPLVGRIVADAVWPGIISHADSDRLRALLSHPDRQRFNGANGRTYLLSGILRCGRCGAGMVGRPKGDVPRYVCPNLPGGDSCGGTATVAVRTDDYVRDLVLVALDSPKMRERLSRPSDTDTDLINAVRRDELALDDLGREKDDGVISRSEYLRRRARIADRLSENRSLLAAAAQRSPLVAFTGTYDAMRSRWDDLNVAQRRAVVAAVVDRVEVRAADRAKRWDPDRFAPRWRA